MHRLPRSVRLARLPAPNQQIAFVRPAVEGALFFREQEGVREPFIGGSRVALALSLNEKTKASSGRCIDETVVPDSLLMSNETLDELQAEQHPDKAFVGRVSRGFEFLGYAITTPGIVGVAKRTWERFVECVARLYEQGADSARIADYVRRWRVWVLSRLRAVACGGVGTNCHRSCRRRADSR
jgi:hypothetical protein